MLDPSRLIEGGMYILDTHIQVTSGQGSGNIHFGVLRLAYIRQGVNSTLFKEEGSFSILLANKKISRSLRL